jgi:uncharacterized protein YndB with AHSA1/START domain
LEEVSMTESIRVSAHMPVPASRVFAAWLDGRQHGLMTGAPAEASREPGGAFRAWGGYIEGKNLALEPERLIVQSWRAEDFPEGAADSRLVVRLDPDGDGCLVSLEHTELPEGMGASYERGWHEHYFEPMRRYFGRVASLTRGKRAAPAKATKKPSPAKATKKPSPAKAAKKPSPAKATKKPSPAKATKKPSPAKAAKKPSPAKAAKKPSPRARG